MSQNDPSDTSASRGMSQRVPPIFPFRVPCQLHPGISNASMSLSTFEIPPPPPPPGWINAVLIPRLHPSDELDQLKLGRWNAPQSRVQLTHRLRIEREMRNQKPGKTGKTMKRAKKRGKRDSGGGWLMGSSRPKPTPTHFSGLMQARADHKVEARHWMGSRVGAPCPPTPYSSANRYLELLVSNSWSHPEAGNPLTIHS